MAKKIFYLAMFLFLLFGAAFLVSENPGVEAEGEDYVVESKKSTLSIELDMMVNRALEQMSNMITMDELDAIVRVNNERYLSNRACLTDTSSYLQQVIGINDMDENDLIEEFARREQEALEEYQKAKEEGKSFAWVKCDPKDEESMEDFIPWDKFCYARVKLGMCVLIEAFFEISQSYNIYFTEQETDRLAKDNLCLCNALKLHIDPPEGEWFSRGGDEDSPPVIWVDDAQKGFEETKAIDVYEYKLSIPMEQAIDLPECSHMNEKGNYLCFLKSSYEILGQRNYERLGIRCDESQNVCTMYPKFGVAATNPLTSGKIKVEANDKLEVVQKEGEYYLVPKKIGMGEVTVTIPDLPAYTSLDNIWFQKGTLPGTTKTFKFSITESGSKE